MIKFMVYASSFPGFRLRMTRWGLLFLVGCLVLGMAAVNTGNNALMALLGLALGSYVVSGMWSRQVLGKVDVLVKLPVDIYADRPAVVEVELVNRSKVFPAYGLVLRDRNGGPLVREALLATGRRRSHAVEVVFPQRGWHELGPWRLEVLMPLGFFLKSKAVVGDVRVLVFPRLLPATAASALRGGGRRAAESFDSRGREGEVTQLRDYQEGDELRQMHWKQTARQQRPVVVDRQRASEKPVFFMVDPQLDDPSSREQLEAFERMISEVATGVALRLREGNLVGLVVGRRVFPPVRSSRRAVLLMRPLAEVQPRVAGKVEHTERGIEV
ncbi:MAG: DUF58 domain-containing protein [Thermoanaerobaculales bacterium]